MDYFREALAFVAYIVGGAFVGFVVFTLVSFIK